MHLNYCQIFLLVQFSGLELALRVLQYNFVGSVFEFSVFHLMIKLIWVTEVSLELEFFYTIIIGWLVLLITLSFYLKFTLLRL